VSVADPSITVTLVKSTIGEKPKNRATVRALGLRRLHHSVQHRDTPAIRGMIHRVNHLVVVTPEDES
jgi:large subunit ribosomal protein L30